MLNGAFPPLDALESARPGSEPDAVRAAVRAQLDAGLELITDAGTERADRAGQPADPAVSLLAALDAGDTGPGGMLVRRWQATAAGVAAVRRESTDGRSTSTRVEADARAITVAAVLTGPYTLASRGGFARDPEELGARLAGELGALAAAGCALAVVGEPAAIDIGHHETARSRFAAAQRALLGDGAPLHAMLAITGGSAWEAGVETIGEAAYASYLLDLIAGPDNWYLARSLPGDRGIVCAALRAPSSQDQASLLVWAARYAASMKRRGLARVGLANASPLGGLTAADARAALAALTRAAALASMEPEAAIEAGLDRRTFAQPPGRGARRGGLPRT